MIRVYIYIYIFFFRDFANVSSLVHFLCMGQIELFPFEFYLCKPELFEIELFLHLTVCKQITDLELKSL